MNRVLDITEPWDQPSLEGHSNGRLANYIGNKLPHIKAYLNQNHLTGTQMMFCIM